jgi:amino acid permease
MLNLDWILSFKSITYNNFIKILYILFKAFFAHAIFLVKEKIMDNDAKVLAAFLMTLFIVSYVFHVAYVKGYAFDWAVKQMEKEDAGHHNDEEKDQH